ncbi:hypothetical protein LINPERPRIM_LOCUS29937 [Linum perenne]
MLGTPFAQFSEARSSP